MSTTISDTPEHLWGENNPPIVEGTCCPLPERQWRRGQCPQCGAPLVCNAYYAGGKGFLIFHDCWQSLGDAPTCDYRRIV